MEQPTPPQAPISPLDALRRICFLLERGRESSYRVDAFRKTIDAITLIPEAELRERVEAGTLKQIKGIGDSSAAIIGQAVRGVLPAYLVSAEEKHGQPLTRGGAGLSAARRGARPAPSNWSEGGSPMEEMALAPVQLGQEWMALPDPPPRLTIANGLSRARLTDQLERVAAINASLGDSFS